MRNLNSFMSLIQSKVPLNPKRATTKLDVFKNRSRLVNIDLVERLLERPCKGLNIHRL